MAVFPLCAVAFSALPSLSALSSGLSLLQMWLLPVMPWLPSRAEAGGDKMLAVYHLRFVWLEVLCPYHCYQQEGSWETSEVL